MDKVRARNINYANLAGQDSRDDRQTLPQCPDSGHHACLNADLGVDVAEVKLNGLLADVNFTCYSLVGVPCQHQLKDFQFTRGEVR